MYVSSLRILFGRLENGFGRFSPKADIIVGQQEVQRQLQGYHRSRFFDKRGFG
jgi:hypothetical protein